MKCQGKLAYQESRGVDLSNGSPKQQVAMAEKKKKYHYKYNKKYNKAKQAVKKEEKLAAKAQRNKEIDELFDDI